MKNAYPETESDRDNISQELDNLEKDIANPPSANTNDFFQHLAEKARDVIFHAKVIPSYRFDYVSPSSTYVTGYTPEEFYADPLLAKKCILPEDFHIVTDPATWDDPNNIRPVEIRWKCKDGRIIWTEHMISGIRNKEGNLESFHIIARDVTERKQAEAALLESQQFNASLLENSPHATVVINPDTSVKYVNPAWEKVNGWTLSEAVGQKVPYPWWPDQFRDTFAEGFKEAMNLKNGKAEIISQKKNGELYWIDMNWVRVTHNNELLYLVINSIDITDRKKMEAALRESEEKFSRTFNSSPNPMCIVTAKEWTFLEVNDSFLRFTGYSKEEAIGRTPVELNLWVREEDSKRMARLLKETGRLNNEEIQSRTKSGEIRTGLFSAETIEIGGNKCCIMVITDITEQVKAKEALRESEEKFSVAFRASPQMMTIANRKTGKFIEVNDSYVNTTGYSREESIGHSGEEKDMWVNPEELKRMVRLMEEQEKMRNEEFSLRMKSGEIRNWLCSADTINIGGESCSIAVATDITERKRMEKALADEATRRRILIEQSSDGIVILDQNGKVDEANQRFADLLGYSLEEVRELHVFDWEFQFPREQVLDMIRTVDETGDHFETRHRRKDGTIYDVEISTNGATVAGQKLIFCVCRDITERKRMEAALRESEEKFSKTFNSSPNPVCVVTAREGTFLEVNDSFLRFSGYSKEEAIGRTPTELNLWVKPEDNRRMASLLKDKGRLFNEEIQSRMKSGEIRTGLFSAETIEIGGNKCRIMVITDITEQVKVKEALRESEERFSMAFRSSPEMMVIVNLLDHKYTEVNESFAKCLGYTREELIGHTQEEFNMWANPEEGVKMTQLMQERGYIRHEEYRFRTKSGEICTWLCSAEILSIGGEPYMLATATDITERRMIQEALRESEEKFSKAFHASPSAISMSKVSDSEFIEVNDTFLRDKGFTREEVMGHKASEFNLWANRENEERIIDAVKKQGQVRNEEIQYRTKSGNIRTGLVSAELLNIGNEPCILVMNNDITQQKLAEEQLRLLSSVTQQVSDSTIITDPNFNITYINRAAEDMFGYTLDEVRGKSLSIFNKNNPTEEARQAITKAIAAGQVYSATVTKQRKDGTTIICDCRLSPLYDEKGQVCSIIDVHRNITKQKEVEAKLQEHKKLIDSILATMPEGVLVIDDKDRVLLANKSLYKIFPFNASTLKSASLKEIFPTDQFFDLHKAVKCGKAEKNTLEFRYKAEGFEKIIYCVIVKMYGERTLLTFSDVSREREEEEKLYLTDRLASIGEMAAGLAHELNNPLTGILALSALLMKCNLPEDCKEDLECIHTEAKRAADIVKNVLLFARNKTGETGQVSVNEVVKDVIRLREYEQRTSNINVVTNLEENLPDIPIEKGQLQQVLLNLISNAEAAIKEMNRPGVITVATQRVNNHVNIIFSDNGCGIKKQIMPRIFDPFFTTKDIGKGTGLGLSICYSIIVKHGGKISVKSQVNEGTTFSIRMPVVM